MRILAKAVGIRKDDVYRIPVNYRCPLACIERAQRFVPALQARPNAPQGSIEEIKLDRFVDSCRRSVDGEFSLLVASRTQAPLVSLCLELINNGIPAFVKGKGFSKNIIKLIDEVGSINANFDEFAATLRDYRFRKVSAYIAMGREDATSDWHDRCETVEALWLRAKMLGAKSIAAMKGEAISIFKDDGSGVKLATWHSSKGLEADVVISVRPEDMPHSKATTPSQKAEEERVQYIEATRSRNQHLLLSGSSLKG